MTRDPSFLSPQFIFPLSLSEFVRQASFYPADIPVGSISLSYMEIHWKGKNWSFIIIILWISVGDLGSRSVFASNELLPLSPQPAACWLPPLSWRCRLQVNTDHLIAKSTERFQGFIDLTVGMCVALCDHSYILENVCSGFLDMALVENLLVFFFLASPYFSGPSLPPFPLTLNNISWNSLLHQFLSNLARIMADDSPFFKCTCSSLMHLKNCNLEILEGESDIHV